MPEVTQQRLKKSWSEFVAIAKAYPAHLHDRCTDPDCGGDRVNIPTGEYYSVDEVWVSPGDKACLDCRTLIRAGLTNHLKVVG